MTTDTNRRRLGRTFARASALCLLALAAVLFHSREARAQWTTSGTNTTTTNSVGIGTAAPEQPLHVNGGTVLSTGTYAGFSFRNRGSASSTDDWVWYSTGNVARFWRGGTDLLGITNDGKFGIGTMTPLARLDVVGAANIWSGSRYAVNSGFMAAGSLTVGNGSANFGGGSGWNANTAGLLLEAADNTEIAVHDYGSRVASFMFFEGASANRLTIGRDMGWGAISTVSINGNVGVGTSTPNATETYSRFTVEGTHPTALSQSLIQTGDGQVGLVYNRTGATPARWYQYLPVGSTDFRIYFGSGLTKDSGDRFTIQGATGNVGVGTPSPGYKFDVQGGAVNASGGLCIAGDCKTSWSQVGGGSQWTTSGSNLLYNSGNVGISTQATSTAKLVIGGTAGAEGLDLASADQYANLRVIRNSKSTFDKDLYLQYGAGAGSRIRFYTDNNETMTLAGGNLNVVGTITGGNITAKYQDVAEWVPSTEKLAAGTVVVLDTRHSNHVAASASAYDTRVAGVISAQPGISLGEAGEGKVLVATTGRVKVKVDATRAPIQIGDLIVTSDVAGLAMKSEPMQLGGRQIHAPGTIIGKALEPLEKGTGEILVLLSLQ